jgi:hypothetical protein
LLASIECGLIDIGAAEVISPFLCSQLFLDAVFVDNSPIPDFQGLQKKIADLIAENAKHTQ